MMEILELLLELVENHSSEVNYLIYWMMWQIHNNIQCIFQIAIIYHT